MPDRSPRPLPLVPVRTTRVRDAVVEQLTRLILEERLRPGSRLPPETELCARLRVGRSTIREALLSLSERGIVDIRHGKGSFVARVPGPGQIWSGAGNPAAGLEDAWAVREALETRLAMYAAERRTSADLRRMERAVRSMDRALARGESGVEQDAAFHQALADAARSPLLQQLLSGITPYLQETRRRALAAPQRAQSSSAEHRAILEAIRNADAVTAGVRMYHHLAFGRQLTVHTQAPTTKEAR